MTRHLPLAGAIGLLAVLAGAITFAASADRAEAHATPVQSDPLPNATYALNEAPAVATISFSETLDDRLSSLEVVNGRGEPVDNDDLSFGPEPERMTVTLKADLEPCFYTVVWETLSAVDGHLLRGSFPFTILNEDGTQPDCPIFIAATGGGGADWDNVLVKWAGLLGATALVGALAFVAWVHLPSAPELSPSLRERSGQAVRRRARWLAWPAVGVLALVAAGELLLQVEQLGGFEFVDEVLSNDWGERWIQRQIVLAAIAIALGASFVLWRSGRHSAADSAMWSALAGGIGYLLLVAAISHGNSVSGSFWAVAFDWLHLVSTAVWVGMLGMLGLFVLWLRRDVPDDERDDLQRGHLQRFSTLAATSVVVLLATGTANGLTHIPDIESLVDTAYGRSLLIKLCVIAGLLAVAGLNAFYLRRRTIEDALLERPANQFRRYLSIAIWVEIALAVVVIFFASILIQYPTARQLEDAESNVHGGTETEAVVGYDEIQPVGDLQVNLTISPNMVGQNSFRATLFGSDAEEVLRVRLRFQPPDEEMAPSQIEMEPAGANAYRAVGPFLSSPGDWDVFVDVRRREVDDISATFPVAVEGHMERDEYAYPLTVGSWWTVAAVVILVASVLMAVWATQWPRRPELAPRFLRVGTAAFSVVGVGLFVLSLLPDDGDSEAAGNPIEPTAESIAIGRSLYMANCAACHGEMGDGNGPQAAELEVKPADFREHLPYHNDEFFFQVITNGIESIGMPAFGDQLTEDERWHILNFLHSEFGEESTPTPEPGHGGEATPMPEETGG